jgi:glycosyltransferase involved in cell wall biosynthesis
MYFPDITVIITNYNNGKYIGDCLISLIEQTFQNFELIIIDEGSTDNSKEIINSYIPKFKNAHFINLSKNIGCVKVKKLGLEKSTGKYCCFVDSDDYLLNNAFEKVVTIFENDNYKNIGLIYTNAFKIDTNNNILGILNFAKDGDSMLNDRVCFHLAIWKMESYNQLSEGFNSNFIFAHDIDLYMKLEEVSGVFFINEPLYCYRIHDNNSSIGSSITGYSYAERIIARYEAQKRRELVDTSLIGADLQNLLINLQRKAIKDIESKNKIYFKLIYFLKRLFEPKK